MAATATVVSRHAAVALFQFIGFKGADAWDNEKIANDLKDIPDMIGGDLKFDDPEMAKFKDEVEAIIKDGGEFVVEGEAPATTQQPKKKAKKEKPAVAEGEEGETAPKEPKAKKEKKVKEPKPPKEKKITAPHLVGQLVAKYSLATGINSTMVSEFGVRYGRENPYRTWFDFKSGWHAIRGYLADPIESAPGVHIANTRPFLAGRILKEKGVGVEINEALAAELDGRYGKINEKESLATLRNAKAAIVGYEAGAPEDDVEIPVLEDKGPILSRGGTGPKADSEAEAEGDEENAAE